MLPEATAARKPPPGRSDKKRAAQRTARLEGL